MFLSPAIETWDTYSEKYSLNEEQILDAGGEIVYPTPRAREMSEPMEVGEVRT